MILEECQFKQDAELAGICISIEELPEPTGLKSPDNTTTIWRVKKKKASQHIKTASPLSSKYVYNPDTGTGELISIFWYIYIYVDV